MLTYICILFSYNLINRYLIFSFARCLQFFAFMFAILMLKSFLYGHIVAPVILMLYMHAVMVHPAIYPW